MGQRASTPAASQAAMQDRVDAAVAAALRTERAAHQAQLAALRTQLATLRTQLATLQTQVVAEIAKRERAEALLINQTIARYVCFGGACRQQHSAHANRLLF